MKEKEFNELLQQIENNTFVGNRIEISGSWYAEGLKRPEALDSDKAILLANALKKNPNITIIELPCNNVGDKGAEALASVATLESIELWDNNITIKGAIALVQSNLKVLGLGWNCISSRNIIDMKNLVNFFSKNKTIINVTFNGCNFSEENNEMISQIIKNNTTLKQLDLSSNYLTDEVLRYIGNNITLEKLYLQNNNITNSGIKYILQNHSLKEINFGDNVNINEISGKLLATHPTLESICLNKIDITIEKLKEFYPPSNSDVNIDLSGDISYNVDDNF